MEFVDKVCNAINPEKAVVVGSRAAAMWCESCHYVLCTPCHYLYCHAPRERIRRESAKVKGNIMDDA